MMKNPTEGHFTKGARTVFQVDNVYEGKSVFIDWKSGLEPAIYARSYIVLQNSVCFSLVCPHWLHLCTMHPCHKCKAINIRSNHNLTMCASQMP